MESIDIGHLRRWIGREVEVDDVVMPRLVEGYRTTLTPHLAPVGETEAPLMIHWCLAPQMAPMAELGTDGHPAKGGFLPPVPLPRRMWAGGGIETLAPLTIGDRVVRRSTIDDVAIKEGRTGPLCFVTVRHDVSTQRGIVVRERQTIVYREAATGSTPARPAPDMAAEPTPADLAPADLTWTVEASPVLLFRYSALTFNGHRIHYDHPYTTGVEGYSGLVVHGPLQATLLFNLAAVLGGRAPSRFDYRGVAPLIAGSNFAVRTSRKSCGEAECWTEDATGRITMKAVAAW